MYPMVIKSDATYKGKYWADDIMSQDMMAPPVKNLSDEKMKED